MHQLTRHPVTALAVLLIAMPLAAQTPDHDAHHAGKAASDSAFAALQERGKRAMGVDQYTSKHVFQSLPDGGRIELQRSVDDSAGVAQIRAHLREIAHAFSAGDFSTPAMVHMQTVPGTSEMTAKRSVIQYVVTELPRGGQVRITSSDSPAVSAVHRFLAFQRGEHRTDPMH